MPDRDRSLSITHSVHFDWNRRKNLNFQFETSSSGESVNLEKISISQIYLCTWYGNRLSISLKMTLSHLINDLRVIMLTRVGSPKNLNDFLKWKTSLVWPWPLFLFNSDKIASYGFLMSKIALSAPFVKRWAFTTITVPLFSFSNSLFKFLNNQVISHKIKFYYFFLRKLEQWTRYAYSLYASCHCRARLSMLTENYGVLKKKINKKIINLKNLIRSGT